MDQGYAVPGGVEPKSYVPAAFSAFSLVVYAFGFRSAGAAERVTRLLCAGVALFVIGLTVELVMEYQTSLNHAYHG